MGLGATMGANFLGDCCWEMEMLALPKDGVVSILAATCPVWSLLFTGFHMVLMREDKKVFNTEARTREFKNDKSVSICDGESLKTTTGLQK